VGYRTRNSDQKVRGLTSCRGLDQCMTCERRARVKPTWNRMTVKTLYFVLRYRDIVQQVSNAVCACKRVAIPSDRRRRTVKFRQVHDPRWRVVRGVVQTSELVRSTGRDFDAAVISGTGHSVNGNHPYSSRVRVLILFESRDPDSETYLLVRIEDVIVKMRGDCP